MKKKYSIARARNELASLVHDVEDGEPVTLTRRGKPVAVLVSLEEYRRLRGDSSGFWGALSAFRASVDLDALDLGPGDFEDLRDNSPGRTVEIG